MKKRKAYRRTFIRQWREYRNLSQERLAERVGKSVGLISLVERGKSPYTQGLLESLAMALGCEPVDLLIRNPIDPDGIWTIWDTLEPPEKRQAVEVLKAIRKAS